MMVRTAPAAARTTIGDTAEHGSSAWRAKANCAGKCHLPWWDDRAEAVALCRDVCRGCEVVEPCALEALGYLKHVGTMGFTTTPQRMWLRSNEGLALEVAAECVSAGACPRELGEWYEAEGPSHIPSEHCTLAPIDIATTYGVSAEVFTDWLRQRGMHRRGSASRDHRKHRRAYELAEAYLQSAVQSGINDGWVPQSEVTALLRSNLDESSVLHTRRAQERSVASAWRNLTNSLVQTWLRAGQINKRPDPDHPDRRQLRWLGDV